MVNFGRVEPDFPEGKKFYIDKFVKIIIENAPQVDYFDTNSLLRNYLDSDDMNRLNSLNDVVESELLKIGVVERYGSWQFIINETVRDSILNPKTKEPFTTKNELHFHGTNYGIIGQDSSFEDIEYTNKQQEKPIKNQNKEKSGIVIRVLDYISTNPLISGILLIIATAIGAYFKWIKS